MGQYFKAINTKKQEYVCPWCINCGAKLWEWAANPQGAIFTYLLRKSSSTGGGDYGASQTQVIELNDPVEFSDVLAKGLAREGMNIEIPEEAMVGRWAGDPVYMIGDYDESNLYETSRTYRNISKELVDEWNRFMDMESHEFKFERCSSCS